MIRAFIRALLPPIVRIGLNRFRGGQVVWRGRYPDWAAAQRVCRGYDDPSILARVEAAVGEVLAGRAAYERDSVLFRESEMRPGILAALLLVAVARKSLRVVDVGGSLGSLWLQHRFWLAGVDGLTWTVVEQPAFVAAGRRVFPGGLPIFREDLGEALAQDRPDVALWSASLQYFSEPLAALAQVAQAQVPYLCLERLALTREASDRITVQEVPASIGRTSYPCRFFAREPLLAALASLGYTLVCSWPALDSAALSGTTFEGWLLTRTPAHAD